MTQTNNTVSLYIHSPWCHQKCPYCDFNAYQKPEHLNIWEQAYLKALLKDLQSAKRLFPQYEIVKSIYLGGGTPSLLSPEYWSTIFRYLKDHYHFTPEIEITMEASPKTSCEWIDAFISVGINRFSLGIQTFQPEILSILGREHSADQAHHIINHIDERARINCDLIYGLRKQTVENAIDDLNIIKNLKNIRHLSWYELTIEKNTLFAKNPDVKGSEDHLAEIEEATRPLLAEWEQYEISAYARNREYSQHNLAYWKFEDYLGFGAGAHSKVTLKPGNRSYRFFKTRYPKDYLRNQYWLSDDSTDEAFDYLLMRLRLFQDIDQSELSRLPPSIAQTLLKWMMEDQKVQGFFQHDGSIIKMHPDCQKYQSSLLIWFSEWRAADQHKSK